MHRPDTKRWLTPFVSRVKRPVWGIDAAPSLLRVFHERFPQCPVACEDIGTSSFFSRRFDAVVALGVMFLLPPVAQQ